MYSKVEISNIVVRGVEVKKSEIRLKSENLHPCNNMYDPYHISHIYLCHTSHNRVSIVGAGGGGGGGVNGIARQGCNYSYLFINN